MGTRADFYVGVGPEAEWLGSIGMDGGLHGLDDLSCFRATNEAEWRASVAAFLAQDESATLPEQGWPWPWDDSATSDWAYTFADSEPKATQGRAWLSVAAIRAHWARVAKNNEAWSAWRRAGSDGEEPPYDDTDPPGLYDGPRLRGKNAFPNMKDRKNVTFGPRSGLVVVGVR